MRKIQFRDAFSMARIIKEGNLKEIIVSARNELKEEMTEEEKEGIYLDVLFSVIGSAAEKSVENEIYNLLGDITEVGAEEIKQQEFSVLIEELKEIAIENDIGNFISSAVKLTK